MQIFDLQVTAWLTYDQPPLDTGFRQNITKVTSCYKDEPIQTVVNGRVKQGQWSGVIIMEGNFRKCGSQLLFRGNLKILQLGSILNVNCNFQHGLVSESFQFANGIHKKKTYAVRAWVGLSEGQHTILGLT